MILSFCRLLHHADSRNTGPARCEDLPSLSPRRSKPEQSERENSKLKGQLVKLAKLPTEKA